MNAIRPVCCHFCELRMHYHGQPGWTPEVRATVYDTTSSTNEEFYFHKRCWDEVLRQRIGTASFVESGKRQPLIREET